jgi:DNA replication protein DnaC
VIVLDDSIDTGYLMSLLPPDVQAGVMEAGKRREAVIAEIGKEEYDRRMEEKRREEFFSGLKKSMKKSLGIMLGSRFKDCTFENFGVNKNNKRAYVACMSFADGFSSDRKGLILAGPVGIGKNHLAAAIANELIKRMIRTYFGSITKIKTKICDAFGVGVDDALDSILAHDVVVINDLGTERDTEFAKELLFDLIDRLYENSKPIIITTNLSDEELFAKYGPRIMSRLIGMCDAIYYEDEDHRMKGN